MGFWFLPILVLSLVHSFLAYYSHTYALILYLNILLTKSHPNKNFHKSSFKNSHPTIASFVSDTSANGPSDAVKKLVKQALHPFHSRPYAILYIHPLSSVPFWCSVALCYFFLLFFFFFWCNIFSNETSNCHPKSNFCLLSLTDPLCLSLFHSSPCSKLPRKTQFYSISKSSASAL